MQVLQLAAGVLFWLSFALGEVFINASIAEHLGFPYDPSLDYSSTWSNLPEENLLKLNDLRIDINDPIEVIAHNILLAIYGGSYDNVYTHDIYYKWLEVFTLLSPKHEKFKIYRELVRIPKGAKLQVKNDYSVTIHSYFGYTPGKPKPNTYCATKNGGYCTSSIRTDSFSMWPLYQDSWDTCKWNCFSNPSVQFDFSGESERTSSADRCYVERPDICLEF